MNDVSSIAKIYVVGVAGETKFSGVMLFRGLGRNWKLRYLRLSRKLLALYGKV